MISIVIPLYNKSSAVRGTLESVMLQTFEDFECIIVNDGSTDKSADVVRDVICNIEDGIKGRFHLVEKENGGVCSARNVGILEAKGDFIALLDGDDLWDKDYLLEMSRMLNDFPQCSLWGINYAEMYEGKMIRRLETGLPNGYRGIIHNYFEMQGRVSDLFCSSSVVIRKDVFDKVGYFDERLKYSEDIDMWYRIIANYPVAFYDRYMVFYQYDAENRAMNRVRKLKSWLPYYVDKYKDPLFSHNHSFYRWIMRWAAIRLKNIRFQDKAQRADAEDAAKRIDYHVLPFKYRLFLLLPYFIAQPLYLLDEYRMNRK